MPILCVGVAGTSEVTHYRALYEYGTLLFVMMKAAALGMPRSEVQAAHSTLALLQNDCQGPRVGSSKRVDLVILAVLVAC